MQITFEIPDRPATQDERIVALVLRREDPPNPGGDADADMPLSTDPSTQALAAAIVAAVEESPYDPALSFVSEISVTDVESQGGAITVLDLSNLLAGDPEAPDPEA